MCFPPRNYNIFTWMFLFPLNARLSLAPLSLSARFIGFFFVDFFSWLGSTLSLLVYDVSYRNLIIIEVLFGTVTLYHRV